MFACAIDYVDGSRAQSSGVRAAQLRQVLDAVHVAGDVVVQLQVHYQQEVAPHVGGVRNEEMECVTGLAAFLKAAQSGVVKSLSAALTAFFGQMETVLRAEQRRSEFMPPESDSMMESPTPACLVAVATLTAALRAGGEALNGPNLQAFNAEVSVALLRPCHPNY
jgi:phage-related minor tail protein